jgi:hypothetical protein
VAPDQPASAVLEKVGGSDRVSGPPFGDTAWQQTSFTYTANETTEYVFWIWTGPGEPADLYVDTVSIQLEE